jgi:prepilin-type N-terminal cleavage/methylation domain-containing protein
MNKKGFTLIELMIVVAIIGILAMVGIPTYLGQQKRAARTEGYTNLENLRLLEEQFFADNGTYAPNAGVAGANQPGNDALIRAAGVLPRFNPATGHSYSYQIRQNANITSQVAGSTAPTPCFLAIATGNTGTRVAGDSLMIDCNNNRNF